MASVVNTNVMSLNAQRQLGKSQLMQNQAMERLSSGLRINSAKDDAAGLAISTGMESQVRGINQAVRNANDGISMAQTAEGSMGEMTNILQRMRELSVQASNDTNSASNRASIQEEIDQLYNELDRIASVTQFNGVNLLDGSAGATNLQIGANTGESLGFTIDAVTTKDLNLNAVSGLGDLNGGRISGNAVDTTMQINGVTISGGDSEGDTVAAAINVKTGQTGVTATAYNVVEGVSGASGVTTGTLTINVGGAGARTIAASGNMQELVDNINRDAQGVTAKLDSEGALVLSNDTGKSIALANITNTGLTADTFEGYISLTSADNSAIEIQLDTTTANAVAAGTFSDISDFGFNIQTGSDQVTGGTVTSVAVLATDKIQVNGVDVGAITGTSAADKAFAINAISDQSGVEATATTNKIYSVDFAANSDSTVGVQGISTSTADGYQTLRINGVSVTGLATASSMDAVVTAINSSGVQGVVASATSDGKLELSSVSGQDIAMTVVNSVGVIQCSIAGGNLSIGLTDDDTNARVAAGNVGDDINRGTISLTGKDGKDVVVTSEATTEANKAAAFLKLGLTDTGGNQTAVGIGLSVSTVQNAENSIKRIDDALENISSSRGRLGAVQNRLTSTISNLENVSQNLSAANSRIRDADFASETSSMSKSQILQQAGTSMLAQANASTQSVLSLLG